MSGIGWERCARCDREISLNVDGTLHQHNRATRTICEGGRQPKPKPAPPPIPTFHSILEADLWLELHA